MRKILTTLLLFITSIAFSQITPINSTYTDVKGNLKVNDTIDVKFIKNCTNNFPIPEAYSFTPKKIQANETRDISIVGDYLTRHTTFSFTPQTAGGVVTVNSTTFVNSRNIIVNVSSNITESIYDVIATSIEGGANTLNSAFEVKNRVWIDLRAGGETLTDGNGAGNDIRYRSGMSMSRDANGMYFTGSSPWQSWVKFEKYSWNRGDDYTISWIIVNPTRTMIGIGSDATNETSSSQYSQMEVQAYFNSSTQLWGLYGNNGTVGSAGNQSHNTTVSSTGVYKIVLKYDGEIGETFTMYQLPSANPTDWNDESTITTTFIIGGSLGADESTIMPSIIPPNGGTFRVIALNIE